MILAVALCEFLPQRNETSLQSRVGEKFIGVDRIVKGVSGCLVQIQDHVQTIFSAPCNALCDPLKSAFFLNAAFRFDQFIVYRDTDMIQSPACSDCKVGFCQKCFVVFVGMFSLREPSAKIDTMLKTFPNSHDDDLLSHRLEHIVSHCLYYIFSYGMQYVPAVAFCFK